MTEQEILINLDLDIKNILDPIEMDKNDCILYLRTKCENTESDVLFHSTYIKGDTELIVDTILSAMKESEDFKYAILTSCLNFLHKDNKECEVFLRNVKKFSL